MISRQADGCWGLRLEENDPKFNVKTIAFQGLRVHNRREGSQCVVPQTSRNSPDQLSHQLQGPRNIRHYLTDGEVRLRGNPLQHDVERPLVGNFNTLQTRFNLPQLAQIFLHGVLDLGLSQGQHAAKSFPSYLSTNQAVNLVKRESKLLEGQDGVQTWQLTGAIIPIPRRRVEVGWLEQPDLIIVAQQTARNLRHFGKLADTKHGNCTPDLEREQCYQGTIEFEAT